VRAAYIPATGIVEKETTMRLSRPLIATALAAAAALLLATGGASGARTGHDATRVHMDTQPVSGTWVGRLAGDSGFVAVVSDGTQVVAYVCDDGRLGSWFFAPDSGSQLQLTSADGSVLNVSLGENADGYFTQAGRSERFEAHKTDKQVLFRADAVADGTRVLAGWIKEGGQTRGTLAIGSTFQPAPSLTPTVPLLLPTVTLTLVPTPMTPDTIAAATQNTTKFVWGAVGDSFASGEGNPEHGINNPGDPSNFAGLVWGNDASITVPVPGRSLAADLTTCHRSDEAPAAKAERGLQDFYTGMTIRLGFVACSGATTGALLGTYTGPDMVPDALLGFARVVEPAQLDRIAQLKTAEGRLDALTMSIGGNNAGFGQIIQDCISPLGPSNCADTWDSQLTTRLNDLANRYDDVENGIVSRFGSQLPVLIQEYPNPLHDGGSGNPPVCQGDDYNAFADVGFGHADDALKNNVTVPEANFAFGIPARLNGAVQAAANTYGWMLIDSHLPLFDGHGICTASPFANLNSAALRRQGQDVPDTSFFRFSDGFMHPNDAGYARMAAATVERLQPLIDPVARSGLAAPANVRVAAAVRNGSLTLRWDDRATSENQYEVSVQPARPADAASIVVPAGATIAGDGYRVRVLNPNAEQFVVPLSGGAQVALRVRACQTGIRAASLQCGAFSTQIIGTNVDPVSPTGVQATQSSTLLGGKLALVDAVSWTPQVDAIEYVVRADATDGTFTETRTSSTSIVFFTPKPGTKYRVAACNRVSCTGYVNAS
jgi:hypothetical protein